MGLRKDSQKKLRKERSKWEVQTAEDFKEREEFLKEKLDTSQKNIVKGKVYITAGKIKGFALDIPEGTRPITSRVRKSIFDLLREDILKKRVLDLYAGTGSFGFEALSRGATSATFVDEDKKVERILNQNAAKTGFLDQVMIIRNQADDYLRSAIAEDEEFDIIFIDPPYKLYNQKDPIKIETVILNAKKLLPGVKRDIKINKNGVPDRFPGAVILKHPSRYDLTVIDVPELQLLDTRKFGNNSISFYVIEKYSKI